MYAKFSCLCSAKEEGGEKVGQKDRSQGCMNEWQLEDEDENE